MSKLTESAKLVVEAIDELIEQVKSAINESIEEDDFELAKGYIASIEELQDTKMTIEDLWL